MAGCWSFFLLNGETFLCWLTLTLITVPILHLSLSSHNPLPIFRIYTKYSLTRWGTDFRRDGRRCLFPCFFLLAWWHMAGPVPRGKMQICGAFVYEAGCCDMGPSKETHITAPQGAREEENPECRATGCSSLFSTHFSLSFSPSLFTVL